MVNWHRVRLVFHRELLDQLRDRRTLAILVGLPVLLYLLLGVGASRFVGDNESRTPTVVVLGATSPVAEELLGQNGFDERWTDPASQSAELQVVSDHPGAEQNDAALAILADAAPLSAALSSQQQFATDVQASAREFLEKSNTDVVVLIYDTSSMIASKLGTTQLPSGTDLPVMSLEFFNSAMRDSLATCSAVQGILAKWHAHRLDQTLQRANFPAGYASIFQPIPVDVADAAGGSYGNLWSLVLPPLIVIMTVIGAFYPAADICAGERERGTLETLLVSPSTRLEIVLGKLGMVLLFSCVSTTLNLTSLGLIGQSALLANVPAGLMQALESQHSAMVTVMWACLLLIPIAAPICATSLALASFADSAKEAQFYLAPLLMILSVVSGGCALPSTSFSWSNGAIPVVGPMLLLKTLLASGWESSHGVGLVIVLAGSIVATAFPVWLAQCRFQRGDLLHGTSMSLALMIWLRKTIRHFNLDFWNPRLQTFTFGAQRHVAGDRDAIDSDNDQTEAA